MSLVGNMLVRLHLAQGEQRMVAESSAGLGIFFFLSGGLLFLWQKKSVFDRTNQFGVEQFSSFWGKLVAKAKDKLISGVAITLLFGGLLILATAYESTWGGIVLLPFYLFVLFMVIGA